MFIESSFIQCEVMMSLKSHFISLCELEVYVNFS